MKRLKQLRQNFWLYFLFQFLNCTFQRHKCWVLCETSEVFTLSLFRVSCSNTAFRRCIGLEPILSWNCPDQWVESKNRLPIGTGACNRRVSILPTQCRPSKKHHVGHHTKPRMKTQKLKLCLASGWNEFIAMNVVGSLTEPALQIQQLLLVMDPYYKQKMLEQGVLTVRRSSEYRKMKWKNKIRNVILQKWQNGRVERWLASAKMHGKGEDEILQTGRLTIMINEIHVLNEKWIEANWKRTCTTRFISFTTSIRRTLTSRTFIGTEPQ